jgi:hypothetical protein
MHSLASPPSRLLFLNALFDLELGGFAVCHRARDAAEITALFAVVGTAGDYVLCDVDVPDEYWAYLNSCGLQCPQPVYRGQLCRECAGQPWGWNANAVSRLESAGAACSHPSLDVVRRLNSRRFSCELCARYGFGVEGATLVESPEQLQQVLSTWNVFPSVIKPLFGNAGYGFLRLAAMPDDAERKMAEKLLAACSAVIIEPWLKRCTDISSRAIISEDGSIEAILHHRCHANRAGTFFADLLDPGDEEIGRWEKDLNAAVSRAAEECAAQGYWGPAGFDSFTWCDRAGETHLAPVIEINARHAISFIAYALRDALAPAQICYFRFISRRRHALPATYAELKKRLGRDAFDRETARGVIAATPLRIAHNGGWVQPSRSAFFIAGNDARDVLAADERLRRTLFRRP